MFEDAQRALIAEIAAFAKSRGKHHPYVYLPYAYRDQQPLESYGAANMDRIRAAARKYDPEGVFQSMVPGGFKITRVGAAKEEGSADAAQEEEKAAAAAEERKADGGEAERKDEL